MRRLSSLVEKAENKIIELWQKHKSAMPKIIGIIFLFLYAYGFVVRSLISAYRNVWENGKYPLFSLDPLANISAVFTKTGIGLIFFILIM